MIEFYENYFSAFVLFVRVTTEFFISEPFLYFVAKMEVAMNLKSVARLKCYDVPFQDLILITIMNLLIMMNPLQQSMLLQCTFNQSSV